MRQFFQNLPDHLILLDGDIANYNGAFGAYLQAHFPQGLFANDVIAGRAFSVTTIQREIAREASERRACQRHGRTQGD